MSTPAPQSNTPQFIPPRCPRCEAALPGIGCHAYTVGSWLILTVHCPNPECLVVLHMQIFPVTVVADTDAAPPEPHGPKILRPS